MDLIVAFFAVLIVFGGNLWYVIQLLKGNIDPTKSTWIIFIITLGFNAFSFQAVRRDWITGAYGLIDFAGCLMILSALLIKSRKKIQFNKFEKRYLLAAACCFLTWPIFKNPLLASLLVQLLLMVGHAPTIHKIWLAKESRESMLSWSLSAFASLISIYPALVRHNDLGIFYALRSAFMCALLVFMTWRFPRKPEKQNLISVEFGR